MIGRDERMRPRAARRHRRSIEERNAIYNAFANEDRNDINNGLASCSLASCIS